MTKKKEKEAPQAVGESIQEAKKGLKTKAMLVRLNISQWEGRKFDKKVTKEIEDAHGVTNAGRFNKILIDPEAIKKVTRVNAEARDFHYRNSLPWRDDGARILPSPNFLDYTKGIQELKEKYREAVGELSSSYDALIDEARSRLNSMFDEQDYPSGEEIRRKHGFSVSFDPLPDAGDFRVDISDDQVEEIRKSIEDRNKNAFQEANKDLWSRLYESVKHMTEKLADPDAIFRDSLVGNLANLCSLLPKLNLEDSELEKKRAEIEDRLCRFDPDDFRKDKGLRKDIAKEAQDILDSMSSFL